MSFNQEISNLVTQAVVLYLYIQTLSRVTVFLLQLASTINWPIDLSHHNSFCDYCAKWTMPNLMVSIDDDN